MVCTEVLLVSLALLGVASAHLAAETEVLLTDGTSKRLEEIRLGDEVRSYDEASRTAAPSTVVRIFESWPPLQELTEVALPGGRSLLTSVAHPIWSSKEGRVVSFSPHLTWEEYGLEAGLFSGAEMLVDEGQLPMSVGAKGADGRSPSNGTDNGPTAAGTRRVMTLGLRPHHWFYAQGVWVHNKGCFLAEASVTLADGSQRPLGKVSPGEAVASWDEVAQRPAVATVRARPLFQRRQEELVQIELGGERQLLATEDHPLWSRGRQSLVSLQPNKTREAYGLSVELLQLGDELEGRALEALPVIGLRRPFLLPSSTAVTEGVESRRLRGGPSLGQLAPGWVEVQTLCLEPHHWFYVEGVRVHNKGCFAPWTPITMADGQQKPLEAVKASDHVLSWDETAQKISVAKVSGVEEFPAGDLLEISMSKRVVFRRLGPGSSNATEEGSAVPGLVVTRDHPIYSARVQGLVSMEPSTTFQHYGLHVGQMQSLELLHQQEGLRLDAIVGNWSGAVNVSRVMTLRLDGHHWFFAQGILVHNKGGGGGFGGGGGGAGGAGAGVSMAGGGKLRAVYTRDSLGARPFAAWIIVSGGSRRRYGTYRNQEDDACTMHSEGEVAQRCQDEVMHRCPTLNHSCCYDCLACEQEACMDRIGGCEEFLAQSFESCEEEKTISTGLLVVLVVLGILFVVSGVLFVLYWCTVCYDFWCDHCECCSNLRLSEVCCWCNLRFSEDRTVAQMGKQRAMMQADQGVLPPFLSFSGTYSENGETKPTTYQLNFNRGLVSGTGQDDDGQANVKGKVCLPVGAVDGHIRWRETRPSCRCALCRVNIEFDGIIKQTPGTWSIKGTYRSNYQSTTGSLAVASAVQQVEAPTPEGTAPTMCPLPVPWGRSWSIKGIYHSDCQSTTGSLPVASAVEQVEVPRPEGTAPTVHPLSAPMPEGTARSTWASRTFPARYTEAALKAAVPELLPVPTEARCPALKT